MNEMNLHPLIEVRELRKKFRVGNEDVDALRGVGIDVRRGEVMSIIGPSGIGKSTLLGLLGGLDTPTSGQVILEGMEISTMKELKIKWFLYSKRDEAGIIYNTFDNRR